MTITPIKPRGGSKPVPDGSLPCRSCGEVVKNPDRTTTGTLTFYGPPTLSRVPAGFDVEVCRCGRCATRLEMAAAILAKHPRVARAHGHVAIDRLDAALSVLDFGGVLRHKSIVADLIEDDARVVELIEDLAGFGGAISWAARAYPASPKRWAHVSADLARDANAAVAALVHKLVEFPMPFAPPGTFTGGLDGCLMCGVGSLMVRESDALSAWGSPRMVNVGTLGGRPRPEPVEGYVCPACRVDVDALGGVVGIPAVERAIVRHLGYTRTIGMTLDFHNTVRAWVALPPGTEPNATPWSHLDLKGMAAALAKLENRNFVHRAARA